MRELVFEILLRLAKAAAAAILGLVAWVVCVGLFGAEPSATLGLLCWVSGAAFILVVQESPI
jgi:hypothetical protein